jgi:hypothetical protein
MSTAVAERDNESTMREQLETLTRRLQVVEDHLAQIARPASGTDWRKALKQARQGWAAMSPERQAECLATFGEVHAELQAAHEKS